MLPQLENRHDRLHDAYMYAIVIEINSLDVAEQSKRPKYLLRPLVLFVREHGVAALWWPDLPRLEIWTRCVANIRNKRKVWVSRVHSRIFCEVQRKT